MTNQRIIIVNENDQVIGHKERGTLVKEDIYRVAALWVTNSQGKILTEEIGLRDIKPTKGPKRRISNDYNYFGQWYKLVVDMPIEDFKIQEAEVERVKWFTIKELKKELRDHPGSYLEGISWCLENL
ncbi:MAG TPA: hypothetical protein VNX65_04555 [Patescibacteria group bacterium]|jgi:isopentenyldiphosphate isomerase|nr:hypothetical protein [Patescibacteria group bacterium]